ncbi:hypothetical protein N9R79_05755 [Vibrio sp.]|nr:hypothetical protein [Vibrio sp.]
MKNFNIATLALASTLSYSAFSNVELQAFDGKLYVNDEKMKVTEYLYGNNGAVFGQAYAVWDDYPRVLTSIEINGVEHFIAIKVMGEVGRLSSSDEYNYYSDIDCTNTVNDPEESGLFTAYGPAVTNDGTYPTSDIMELDTVYQIIDGECQASDSYPSGGYFIEYAHYDFTTDSRFTVEEVVYGEGEDWEYTRDVAYINTEAFSLPLVVR